MNFKRPVPIVIYEFHAEADILEGTEQLNATCRIYPWEEKFLATQSSLQHLERGLHSPLSVYNSTVPSL
jgi:hypothetical protein